MIFYCLHRVQDLPEQPPEIDWAYYKKKIPVQGLVDKLQKEYQALKVPFPEDKYSSIIDQQYKDSVSISKNVLIQYTKTDSYVYLIKCSIFM